MNSITVVLGHGGIGFTLNCRIYVAVLNQSCFSDTQASEESHGQFIACTLGLLWIWRVESSRSSGWVMLFLRMSRLISQYELSRISPQDCFMLYRGVSRCNYCGKTTLVILGFGVYGFQHELCPDHVSMSSRMQRVRGDHCWQYWLHGFRVSSMSYFVPQDCSMLPRMRLLRGDHYWQYQV